jgi:hypothetical protein
VAAQVALAVGATAVNEPPEPWWLGPAMWGTYIAALGLVALGWATVGRVVIDLVTRAYWLVVG